MEARAVRFDRYGGREVLEVREVELAEPGAGQVRVRVRAAGLNPGEAAIREGALADQWPTDFPCGEGSDFAGVVERVGPGVTAVAPGDEVLGWSDERSSHATHVVVPGDQVVGKPENVSWEVAGSLKVAATTAYAALEAVAASEGDTVLVSAAAGGVGVYTVQLARLRGARVVGVASQPHHEWLRSVGVIPVAYGDDLSQGVRDAAPDGVDAAIDLFGPEYVDLALELGVAPGRIDTIIAFERAGEVGAQAVGGAEASRAEVLRELVDHVAAGRIEVPIAATYPLDDVRGAYAELEERHTRGKIVLVP